MPVDDRPPRVLHHLLPVLDLGALAVVAQGDAADRVGGADAVVVTHRQLQVHPLDFDICLRGYVKKSSLIFQLENEH